MAKIIAGIDEAGRGAVIGSLVIAGVSIKEEDLEKLKALKLKDSKLLTQKKREELALKIEAVAKDIVILKVGACKIDSMRKQGINLNRIEAMRFADIINLLGPDKSYIDSPDVNPARLELILRKMLHKDSELVVEHKADFNYPIVSAASIIAKVTREEHVKELKKKWGDIGPGYSSNEHTISWLKAWISKNKEWPDIVRKSWQTAKTIKADHSQKGISSFFSRRGKECKDPSD